MPRRPFLFLMAFFLFPFAALAADPPRPHILWLTSEDHGPQMGCYGDTFATTPNVDKLASRGVLYLHAWSNAPVCAPARTAIISGLYPPSTGAEHMRSMVPFPAGKNMFPVYLREAGYYCTNNVKEDYNISKTGKVWDESSGKAHWKGRKDGQPFFAVFNSTKSHESQIRTRPHKEMHDPAKVRVPAYHPDTPEVRKDWAQYYDKVSAADADAGARLRELEEAGLADDTIVFYFGDHGSGMPRSKRSAQNSGLHVPMVVYIPDKFKHLAPADYKAGGKSDRLVSFVDLAPTVLSLAGIEPARWMQGHAFLGKFAAPLQPYVYGFRGRMDERSDLVRSATDGRYVYVRNYMPHKLPGQHVEYMFQTPTTRVWRQMFDAGKLNAAQSAFWKPKAPEELYDLSKDPDEVNNLAGSAEHAEILVKLRQAQRELALKIRDVGFLPEGEMHSRSQGTTPYDMGHDEGRYPLARILDAADAASMLATDATPALKKAMSDGDSAVRYWGAMGFLMRGKAGVVAAHDELMAAMKDDPSPYVRIVAAEALGQFGGSVDLKASLDLLIALAPADKQDVFVSIAALSAIDALGDKAAPLAKAIKALPAKTKLPDGRFSPYVPRLLTDLNERFK